MGRQSHGEIKGCSSFSRDKHRDRQRRAAEMAGVGAFWGTKVMEIVKKHDSGGLLWKRIKLTSTRKANAKKRLHRVWQNEAVLRACSVTPPVKTSGDKVCEVGEQKRDIE